MSVNGAVKILEYGTSNCPEKTAFIFRNETVSYAQLESAVRNFAARLTIRGIGPADRVVLQLLDSPAFVIAFLGAIFCGAIPVPVGYSISLSDCKTIFTDSGAKLFVTDEHKALLVDDFAREIEIMGYKNSELFEYDSHNDKSEQNVNYHDKLDVYAYSPTPEACAFILYTSGSTGAPKGVMHRHDDLNVPIRTIGKDVFGDVSGDVLLSASKLSFSYGLQVQVAIGLAGGCSVVLNPDDSSPEILEELIAKYRPTLFFAVPAVYDSLMLRTVDCGTDLSFLRVCVSSGEAMPAVIHDGLKNKFGISVIEIFGATETFTSFMVSLPGKDPAGSLGSPVSGFEVRIVDEFGNDVEGEKPGRLLVHGPGLTTGYWAMPEKTKSVLLPEGWLDTGDVCILKDGIIRHAGRSDDLFRSVGQWVSPMVVEDCLLRHPAVDQCAVASCSVRGMLFVCGYVVPVAEDVTESLAGDIIRFAKKGLPRHMCPVRIVYVNELPRTPTGKIQRHRLAALSC